MRAAARSSLPVTDPVPVRDVAVSLLGPGACEALATGARGRVLTVFRRSIYVETDAECQGISLACLGPPGLGAGPLNVLCELPEGWGWPEAGVRVGQPLEVRSGTLVLGAGLRLSFADVEAWAPVPPAPLDGIALREGLRALAAGCREVVTPRGWGRMLPAWLDGGPMSAGAAGLERRLLSRAADGALALNGWLRARKGAQMPEAIVSLLGLGDGLTPAGDDFLGGALIALHHLGNAPVADKLAEVLRPWVGERTHTISAAHLDWAARGLGSGALHAVLHALTAPDPSALIASLRALDRIGHTSGWDALAGAVVVCCAHAKSSD